MRLKSCVLADNWPNWEHFRIPTLYHWLCQIVCSSLCLLSCFDTVQCFERTNVFFFFFMVYIAIFEVKSILRVSCSFSQTTEAIANLTLSPLFRSDVIQLERIWVRHHSLFKDDWTAVAYLRLWQPDVCSVMSGFDVCFFFLFLIFFFFIK